MFRTRHQTTPYCGPICQTAHWPTHKESCDGRLRKMGMDHLNKAKGFHQERNLSQALRHCDLALTKLKQLKDRSIEAISEALHLKCVVLGFLVRYVEQLECAKEWYCLWNTKPTDMGAIQAALALIQSCMANKKFEDAHLYASTLNGIINHKHDNKIPEDQRQPYIAQGAYYLGTSTLRLAQSSGIPLGEKQKAAGQQAIAFLRRALEIHTQLHGAEDDDVATDMMVLADALDYYNEVDDEEVLRLHHQAKAIFARVQGHSSVNVAAAEGNLVNAYSGRPSRACAANDIDRELENLALALASAENAVQMYRALHDTGMTEHFTQKIFELEERRRYARIHKAAKAAGLPTYG